MDLSKLVAVIALIIVVALAAGHSLSAEIVRPVGVSETVQEKLIEREAMRRAALADHTRRKDDFQRRCSGKPYLTRAELEACRQAYRRL
jgi:hypothetical protein